MANPYADVTVYEGDTITAYRLQCDPSKEIGSLTRQLEVAESLLEFIEADEDHGGSKTDDFQGYAKLIRVYRAKYPKEVK